MYIYIHTVIILVIAVARLPGSNEPQFELEQFTVQREGAGFGTKMPMCTIQEDHESPNGEV